MFTNSLAPRIGGVPQSIQSLRDALAARGHGVLTVAPSDPEAEAPEEGVVRVPVFLRTRAADLPVPVMLPAARRRIAAFRPDVVHSHHPFLLGRTALHTAARLGLPLVYTFHTRYDLYAAAAGGGGARLEGLLRRMTLGYCRTADAVIAPSRSVRDMLLDSQVTKPVATIPSGVDPARVLDGDGARLRAQTGIGQDAFVVGHVGRLEREKNLGYLATAICAFLQAAPDAIFLLGGDGSQLSAMRERFLASGVADRVICLGPLRGRALADAYAAMDLFACASTSETQGLTVAEAQTAGVPVIALASAGIGEMLALGGGILLERCTPPQAFAEAVKAFSLQPQTEREVWRRRAVDAARACSPSGMAEAAEALYETLIRQTACRSGRNGLLARLAAERRLLDGVLCGLPAGQVRDGDA